MDVLYKSFILHQISLDYWQKNYYNMKQQASVQSSVVYHLKCI